VNLPPEINADDILNVEVIEPRLSKSDFSVARRLAVQVLYEVDSTQHAPAVVMAQRLEGESIANNILQYFHTLVNGVLQHCKQLDTLIQRFAVEWPLEQVAIIDRNILRLATYELIFQNHVPVGVVIDEALLLSDLFGSEATPRFVNGVLGALARNLDEISAILYTVDETESEEE